MSLYINLGFTIYHEISLVLISNISINTSIQNSIYTLFTHFQQTLNLPRLNTADKYGVMFI